MRFLYGIFLGFLITVIAAILYLAFLGGEYLLVLSPKYQEMKSQLATLGRAAEQRDQLAGKLENLEQRFRELSQRFAELQPTRPIEAPSPPPTATPVTTADEPSGP